MADRPPTIQLNVNGDMHLTINNVEARQATPTAALWSARPEDIRSRPRAGSLVKVGGRWMLQVAAAVTSSAAAAGLLGVLGIG